MWPSIRVSPTPVIPSSVCTCTYVRLRHGVPTTCVLIPVMRTEVRPSSVRYFVTRSKCWRDSKDGVVGVSMGRAHNGFGSFETYGQWSAPNLHSKAYEPDPSGT
ncbi:hypothetical protein GCM10010297_52640 [Streptomyces malachitofuscus]|nr:hypothetical protein GCM10010297_52640 [Streptomyces malachitofuscus]